MQKKVAKTNVSATEFILNSLIEGKTCGPISLKEFHAFLEYKEHSVENLEFYQWFQDYKLRFAKLPVEQQDLCPTARTLRRCSSLTGEKLTVHTEQSRKYGEKLASLSPTTSQLHTPNFQLTDDFDDVSLTDMKRNSSTSTIYVTPLTSRTNSIMTLNSEQYSNIQIKVTNPQDKVDSTFDNFDFSTDDLFAQVLPPDSPFFKDLNPDDLQLEPLTPAKTRLSSFWLSSRNTITKRVQIFQRRDRKVAPLPANFATSAQPFRNEVDQIIQTYLAVDAAKELNLPSTMRKSVIFFATQTTHPSIFEPIVQHVHNMMRECSLKNFIKDAAQKIDSHTRWIMVRKSLLAFMLAFGLLLPMILFGVSRWWRMLAFPILYIGTSNFIAVRKRLGSQRNESILKLYEVNAIEEIGKLTSEFANSIKFIDKVKTPGEKKVKNTVTGEAMQSRIVGDGIVGAALVMAGVIQFAVMLVPENLISNSV
ncbi:94_t:CDS:2 [Ambispora leptoticha]|uniref:94_t:CDS:1 n=1 Tax=Ambispora leptoticha TaxID=144679 RepID=A0A9N9FL04_9GLOM|nr:94_t:CDS:2 [Ambispora leptoticha]